MIKVKKITVLSFLIALLIMQGCATGKRGCDCPHVSRAVPTGDC